MTAKFITLEGIEGAGKTSAMKTIINWFEGQGQQIMQTREPGGTPLAEKIRDLLLDVNHQDMSHKTELLLMFAARASHVEQKIKPCLSQGINVISDRFTEATYAYQHGARGLPKAWVETLETLVQENLRPDLTLVLDVPVEVSFARIDTRGERDRFEQEKAEFFNKVRQNYLQQAEDAPSRFVVIDAAQPLDVVAKLITQALEVHL